MITESACYTFHKIRASVQGPLTMSGFFSLLRRFQGLTCDVNGFASRIAAPNEFLRHLIHIQFQLHSIIFRSSLDKANWLCEHSYLWVVQSWLHLRSGVLPTTQWLDMKQKSKYITGSKVSNKHRNPTGLKRRQSWIHISLQRCGIFLAPQLLRHDTRWPGVVVK